MRVKAFGHSVRQERVRQARRAILNHLGEPLFAGIVDRIHFAHIQNELAAAKGCSGSLPATRQLGYLGFTHLPQKLEPARGGAVMNVIFEVRRINQRVIFTKGLDSPEPS
jgi:hypothetical protein